MITGYERENKLHTRNFDVMYQQMIPVALQQNKQAEANAQQPLYNNHNRYGSMIVPYDDTRALSFRFVKIPTFAKENRMMYYTMFFVNIEWYTTDDIKRICALCLNNVDHRDMYNIGRGYTIFLSGKQRGRVHPLQWNTLSRQYNTWRINTLTSKGIKRQPSEIRAKILKQLMTYFERLIKQIKNKTKEGFHYYKGEKHTHTLYGQLKKDFDRVHDFVIIMYKGFHNWIKLYWKQRHRISNILENTSSPYSNIEILKPKPRDWHDNPTSPRQYERYKQQEIEKRLKHGRTS